MEGTSDGFLQQLGTRLQAALGADYVVERLVGRGASACVFAVREPGLGRTIAVKVLLPGMSPAVEGRFRREARLVARVRHPGVIPIYFVREQDGLSYFGMPFVEGESLREVIAREGRLALDEVVRILTECAEGLEAAHQTAIVHRDVKPENILLEGSLRRVVLTDFGIARGLREDESRVTGQGDMVGTPEYMSPEQAAGEEHLDERTDVYALGVVGFEMLTGRLPFEAASWHGLLLKHISEIAPRAERFRHDCPTGLADLIARCLAKNPADRWQSMGELREALTLTTVTKRPLPPLLALVPFIGRRTPRRSMLSQFRRLAAMFVVTAVGLFLYDLRDGLLDFAPLLLLILGFLLISQYGALAHAGFSWHDLIPKARRRLPAPAERATPEAQDLPSVQQTPPG
jgi:serine/threonine-protein kinase